MQRDWTDTFLLAFLSKAFKIICSKTRVGLLSIPVDLFKTIQLPVYRLIIYAVTLMFTQLDERLSLWYKSLSRGLSRGYGGSCQRQTNKTPLNLTARMSLWSKNSEFSVNSVGFSYAKTTANHNRAHLHIQVYS